MISKFSRATTLLYECGSNGTVNYYYYCRCYSHGETFETCERNCHTTSLRHLIICGVYITRHTRVMMIIYLLSSYHITAYIYIYIFIDHFQWLECNVNIIKRTAGTITSLHFTLTEKNII